MKIISHTPSKINPEGLTLYDHNRHLQHAIEILIQLHSSGTVFRQDEFFYLCMMVVLWHDSGKAIKEFQRYIQNPQAWRGNPLNKAHALASSVMALLYLGKEKSEPSLVVAATYMIAGHHTALPTRERYRFGFKDQIRVDVLKEQLKSIDYDALAKTLRTSNLGDLFDNQSIDRVSRTGRLIETYWDKMPQDRKSLWAFRVKTQLAYSLLLEADRAQLILGDLSKYAKPVGGESLTQDKITRYLAGRKSVDLNKKRSELADKVLERLDLPHDERIYALSAPTGYGKTALSARWAAKCIETGGPKKVIYVSPYLSITRQTEGVLRSILGVDESGGVLMPYHSISERNYADTELDGPNQTDFYLDTWKSGIIVTTYDQLLLAMFSPRAKHQMRFHNLCDALIILDEFQSVPCGLWDLFGQMLDTLTKAGNTRVLAMSATMPNFFDEAYLLPTKEDRDNYRLSNNRYTIYFDQKNRQTIKTFTESLDIKSWKSAKKRVMIVVNTRRTARKVRDFMLSKYKDKSTDRVYYISTDITPGEREHIIEQIQENNDPCVVVTTQCIEAGVDIDVDLIYSDFAPLDSLIQRAGRLNRHGTGKKGSMYVVCLVDDAGKLDCEKVYDLIHLAVTQERVRAYSSIDEQNLPLSCDRYFQELRKKKNDGDDLIEDFINWKGHLDIRTLLRGDQSGRDIQFLCLHDHPEYLPQIKDALELDNPYERRRALRALAPKITNVTISRYSYECPDPDSISEWVGPFRVLDEKHYTPYRGLSTDEEV